MTRNTWWRTSLLSVSGSWPYERDNEEAQTEERNREWHCDDGRVASQMSLSPPFDCNRSMDGYQPLVLVSFFPSFSLTFPFFFLAFIPWLLVSILSSIKESISLPPLPGPVWTDLPLFRILNTQRSLLGSVYTLVFNHVLPFPALHQLFSVRLTNICFVSSGELSSEKIRKPYQNTSQTISSVLLPNSY